MYLKKSKTVKFTVQLPVNQANKLKEFKTKANQEGVKLSMNDLIELILDNFLKTVNKKEGLINLILNNLDYEKENRYTKQVVSFRNHQFIELNNLIREVNAWNCFQMYKKHILFIAINEWFKKIDLTSDLKEDLIKQLAILNKLYN